MQPKVIDLAAYRSNPLSVWLRLHYQLEQILLTNLRIALAGHRDFLRMFVR